MADFSFGIRLCWDLAANEAYYLKHELIEPEHLFIGVCKLGNFLEPEFTKHFNFCEEKNRTVLPEAKFIHKLFLHFELNRKGFYREVRKSLQVGNYEHKKNVVHRSKESKKIFDRAEQLALEKDSNLVIINYFLLALIENLQTQITLWLSPKEVQLDNLKSEVKYMTEPDVKNPKQEYPTPFLDRFGIDLVAKAKEGAIKEVIGEKIRREMREVIRVLAQSLKNNPLLIGESGVGKTAVIEGLAWRISQNRIPDIFKNCRIVQLKSLEELVAGTKYRGEFEERLQFILKEVIGSKDVILFIDEIHTVIGAGASSNALEAANIIKPALSRGDFRVIGATTLSEYRKYIDKDPAMERRFQMVKIQEPSPEETYAILMGIKPGFEEHHRVTITKDAVKAAVDLSVKYIPDRNLPDKAIDLLDKSCSETTVEWPSLIPDDDTPILEPGIVSAESVAVAGSNLTGIPAAKLSETEKDRLLNMTVELKEKIIGQDEACEKVALAVQRSRAGLKDSDKPMATFLFLGPTGVGKTELAKVTAEFLFGSQKSLVRLDMSEFIEKHNIARLIGSPPGYVGYEEEGQLIGQMRKQPHCVVLLDEMEKAHPEVLNLFLQLFDEGRLTDAKGRTVDASNALFIMTSNVTLEKEVEVGFRVRGVESIQSHLVKQGFRPEFINRIDEIILFSKLDKDNIGHIVEKMLKDLRSQLLKQEIELRWTDAVILLLSEQGFDTEFGARNLQRMIKQKILNEIAGKIISDEIQEGDKVFIDVKNDQFIFEIDSGDTIKIENY